MWIYSAEDGESHFEEVRVGYSDADFVPPAPPVALSSFEPADQFAFELVGPGWHPTLSPECQQPCHLSVKAGNYGDVL